VEVLVKAGAEANSATMPPLLDATLHGFPQTVEALLDNGADIQAMDYTHYTPLHWAAWGGNVETVKILVKRGADVHYRDDWGYTPLQWAEHWATRILSRF
jgi:ankyrin repeat protein